MKLLTCLFTYNRPQLLANAVRSVDEFFPWGDRLIIDDGSSDPRVRPYLEELASNSSWRFIRDRPPGRYLGGLAFNMRFALDHALEEGYDLCFFMQDDSQFVYQPPDYLSRIVRTFEKAPDAVQVQPLMLRRLFNYADWMEYVAAAEAYRTNRGFSPVGIWNLAVVRCQPDYHVICHHGQEGENSGYWLEQGFRLYYELAAPVAVIPWTESHAGITREEPNTPIHRDAPYLLRPLSQSEIAWYLSRDPSAPGMQEHFNLHPENSDRPVWHRKGHMMDRYYHLCRKVWEAEQRSGGRPKPIAVLDRWRPSDIPANASHITAYHKTTATEKSRATAPAPSIARSAWRKIVPGRARKFIRTFSVRDYLGYLRLKHQLQRERRALPFFGVTG
jgi:hypothetical protein